MPISQAAIFWQTDPQRVHFFNVSTCSDTTVLQCKFGRIRFRNVAPILRHLSWLIVNLPAESFEKFMWLFLILPAYRLVILSLPTIAKTVLFGISRLKRYVCTSFNIISMLLTKKFASPTNAVIFLSYSPLSSYSSLENPCLLDTFSITPTLRGLQANGVIIPAQWSNFFVPLLSNCSHNNIAYGTYVIVTKGVLWRVWSCFSSSDIAFSLANCNQTHPIFWT